MSTVGRTVSVSLTVSDHPIDVQLIGEGAEAFLKLDLGDGLALWPDGYAQQPEHRASIHRLRSALDQAERLLDAADLSDVEPLEI